MARSYLATASEYMLVGSAVVSALPFTLACWVQPTAKVDGTVMAIAKSGSDQGWFILDCDPTTPQVYCGVQADAGGTGFAVVSTPLTLGRWIHLAAIFASTTSRTVVLNGTAAATDTTSVATPTGLDQTAVGMLRRPTPAQAVTGGIATPSVWNVALDRNELVALAQGADPITVRPQSLVETWDDFGTGRVAPRQSMTTVLGRPVSTKRIHQNPEGPRGLRTYGTRRVLRVG